MKEAIQLLEDFNKKIIYYDLKSIQSLRTFIAKSYGKYSFNTIVSLAFVVDSVIKINHNKDIKYIVLEIFKLLNSIP